MQSREARDVSLVCAVTLQREYSEKQDFMYQWRKFGKLHLVPQYLHYENVIMADTGKKKKKTDTKSLHLLVFPLFYSSCAAYLIILWQQNITV